jgi:hypothetical protein
LPGSWEEAATCRSCARRARGRRRDGARFGLAARLKLPDFSVRWDPQVLRYLDYFKNDPKGGR